MIKYYLLKHIPSLDTLNNLIESYHINNIIAMSKAKKTNLCLMYDTYTKCYKILTGDGLFYFRQTHSNIIEYNYEDYILYFEDIK